MIFLASTTLIVLAAIILVLLLAAFIYIEINGVTTKGRWLRLPLTSVALLALFLMVARPAFWQVQEKHELIILTAGAESSSISTAKENMSASPRLVSISDDISTIADEQISQLSGEAELYKVGQALTHAVIVGEGLSPSGWSQLQTDSITFIASTTETGIIDINYPRIWTHTKPLMINGEVRLAEGAEGWLILSEGLQPIDSLNLTGSANCQFRFRATPRDTGKVDFRLSLFAEAKLLEENRFGINISPSPVLGILVVTASPLFDLGYLKRWAVDKGHKFAWKARLSRHDYRQEFVNANPFDLSNLSASLLERFDLLIIDGRSLQDLRGGELNQLDEAIRSGLGMLILVDKALQQRAYRSGKAAIPPTDMVLIPYTGLDFRLGTLFSANYKAISPIKLPAEPFELHTGSRSWPIFYDELRRPVAAYSPHGAGAIGLSLIRESYRMVLRGNRLAYNTYWTGLLGALISENSGLTQVYFEPANAIQNHPLTITIHAAKNPGLLFVKHSTTEPDTVFLAQSALHPTRYQGIFWPRATGWHHFATGTDIRTNLYVSSENSWPAWQSNQKTQYSSRFTQRNGPATVHNELTQPPHIPQPLTRYWFAMVLILALAGLWVEQNARI